MSGNYKSNVEAAEAIVDVAPETMLTGCGTNIMLLNYFAHSLPVVSTPFGARALDKTLGDELVIAEIDP